MASITNILRAGMAFYSLISICILTAINISAQNVGIGTVDPTARLHVVDGAVVFSSAGDIPQNAGNSPINGAGRRMMWYADRAAFRAGYVPSSEWDQVNIGSYSVALGYGTAAYNAATTAFGYQTTAIGVSATAVGYQTVSKAVGGFVAGINNDITDNPDWFNALSSDRIFQVGNGNFLGERHNALTVLRNGNLGIGHLNPIAPLSFSSSVGEKITFYGDSSPDYGIGVQPYLMQFHTDGNAADIAFGYGSSSSFTENLRIKGTGTLQFPATLAKKIILYPGGIGDASLSVFGNELRIASDYNGADITFGYDNRSSGFTEKFRMKANGALNVNGSDGQTTQVLKSNGGSSPAWTTLGSILQTIKSGTTPQTSDLLHFNSNGGSTIVYDFINFSLFVTPAHKSRLIISALFDIDPDFCPGICPDFGGYITCKVFNNATSQLVDSVQLKATAGAGSAGNATIANFMTDVNPGQYTVRFYAQHFNNAGFWGGRVTAKFSSVMVLPID